MVYSISTQKEKRKDKFSVASTTINGNAGIYFSYKF